MRIYPAHRSGGWKPGVRFVGVMGAAILAITGCGNGNPTTNTNTAVVKGSGGAVVVRLPADWNTLDPQQAYGFNSGEVGLAAYDRLISWDPVASKSIPYVASSWKVNSSNIVFTVRTDVVCSDGTKMTSQDLTNSFQRMINLGVNIAATKRSFGAPPWTMTTTDATHITFGWTNGLSGDDILYGFANYTAGIVCPAGLVSGADFEHNSFGSGPFVLQSAVHGTSAVFKVHKGWNWGPNGAKSSDDGFPDTLTYQIVGNPTTAANELTSGGLDVSSVAGADIDRLLSNSSLSHVALASNGVEVLAFNETPGHPTTDPILRQALMMALEGKAYNTAEYSGHGTNSTSIVTSTTPCYLSNSASLLPGQDISKAKALLTSNGYTYSGDKLMKSGTQVALSIPGEPGQGSGPEYLQSQFSQLGIAVDAPVLDFTTWNAKQFGGKWDAIEVEFRFAAPPQAWIPFMSGPVPPAGVNVDYTLNSDVDTAVNTFRSSSGDTRCNALKTMQTSLLKNHDVFPLVAQNAYWFSKGWNFNLYYLYAPDPTSFRKRA
jgi:peptide/nickel transport system substrate-binding protein